MQLDRVRCNTCRTLLEIAPTTNFVTCGGCEAELAVRRTGTSLFTEPIAGSAPSDAPPAPADPPPANQDLLQQLQRQQEINRLENELNRLDINWEREKEGYKVSGRYGHRYLPTKGSSVGQGLVLGVFGSLWTVFAFGITTGFTWSLSEDTFGPPPIIRILFPLFGVVFVIFGVASAVKAYQNAEGYEQAEQRYLSRKEQLRRQIGDLRHRR